MRLVRDPISFQVPLDDAIANAEQRVLAAGDPVDGAEARVRLALDAKRDLEVFCSRLVETLRNGAFIDLPRVRDRPWRPIPDCHHLTVGPWRGIFLLKHDQDLVLAVLFSEAPHDMGDRLKELIAEARRATARPPNPEGPP